MNNENDRLLYPKEETTLQKKVKAAFYISEIRDLLVELRGEVQQLQGVLCTEQDQQLQKQAVDFFDGRMQATVYYTLKNLEGYQRYGWQQLFQNKEEEGHGTIQKTE